MDGISTLFKTYRLCNVSFDRWSIFVGIGDPTGDFDSYGYRYREKFVPTSLYDPTRLFFIMGMGIG
jgi:hypothetical protein